MNDNAKKALIIVVAIAAVGAAVASFWKSNEKEVGHAGAYYGSKDPNSKSPKQMEMEKSGSGTKAPAPKEGEASEQQRSESPGN